MLGELTQKEAEQLEKKVTKKETLVWDALNKNGREEIFSFGERYKAFLDNAKTERESVEAIVKIAESAGFVDIGSADAKMSGKKFYKTLHGKAIALAVIGRKPVSTGVNIIGSHIDSPRLDLKQNPLYEELDLALLKTHYYGGIKKYHWLARPLAIHGKVILASGEEIDIVIGEAADDPVFTISDLLPHLSQTMYGKKLADAFEGEKLNLLAGSLPAGGSKIKNRFRLAILQYLNEKYGMVEEDFTSAEIEIIPAGKARDLGFDRSMTGAYGQDDRVCAFTSLEALTGLEKAEKSCVALFFDKEEIGSEGNTGAQSRFIETFVSDLLAVSGENTSERTLRRVLAGTSALSADVNAGVEPDYQSVHEKRNAAKIGRGVCITKFTGVRGKAGSSDANAEFIGRVRKIFNDSGIVWQTGELGKIDQGGGGTIAKFLASYGMDIVDCGPPVLSMHSPFEVTSKADVYMTYMAYKAFFASAS